MILGLDVSTSITGATILDKDGKMIYNELWDTRNKNKFPTVIDKAKLIQEQLQNIKNVMQIIPSHVYIEEPFTFFNSGGSSARTMATLQRFNGIVSWICADVFGLLPELIMATTARKTVGVKTQKGVKAKETSFNFVLANEPNFIVEYTKHGNPKPGMMDKSDSWIIAKAGYILCNQKN